MSRGTLPPESLFWATLPRDIGVTQPSHGESRGVSAAMESLQHELPMPLADLAVCLLPTDDGTTLACATPRARLTNLPPDMLEAGPATLPHFVPADVDPSSINFLQGSLEPASLRRARSLRTAMFLGSVAVLALAFGIALDRRTTAWLSEAQRIDGATTEVVRAAMGAGSEGTLKALEHDLARLRHLGTLDPRDLEQPDAGRALERWLASLAVAIDAESAQSPSAAPRGSFMLNSIRVRPERVDVSITLNRSSDADGSRSELADGAATQAGAFLERWRTPEGWKLEQPRVQMGDGAVQIAISATPAQASEGPR